MADIKVSTEHTLNQSELLPHLENLADEVRTKFGIESHLGENVVHLSGSTLKNGLVTWNSNSLTIELTLGFLGKMFKDQIEKEIRAQMEIFSTS